MSSDLDKRFGYHPADTEEKRVLHGNARDAMRQAAEWVEGTVPVGREQALAITKLEEAMMWASAGIARGHA